MKRLLLLIVIPFILAGCIEDTSADKERKAQEHMSMQAVNAVGMPAIVNFAEKRLMRDILELRDRNPPTITYIRVAMTGEYKKVCDSVGYGLPYATQYTNPMMASMKGYALPQPDPNGLFSPASAEGTWVVCIDPATKKIGVLYIEDRIIVSPFPLVMQ